MTSKFTQEDLETYEKLVIKDLDPEKYLLDNYRKLNQEGQAKAIERIEELTEIPRYLSEEEK